MRLVYTNRLNLEIVIFILWKVDSVIFNIFFNNYYSFNSRNFISVTT